MKVVIDTNILVSEIGWASASRKIIDSWIDDKLTVIVTPEIMEEYKRVSAIFSKKYPHLGFEHDDDKFITCALSAKAKYY